MKLKNMENQWPKLHHPPIIMVLFQIKYNQDNISVDDFLQFDEAIKKKLSKRVKNIHTNIKVPGSITLGVSKISGTSNAEVSGYTYLSEDQKTKLTIESSSITYQDEHPYEGWESFKCEIDYFLRLFDKILNQHVINRLSIRFINQFSFEHFEDPTIYFKTLISSSDDTNLSFPILKYGFRLMLTVPETNIYSVVNQNLESIDKYYYIFDIDVLDKQLIVYELQTILTNLEGLRRIKNDIFFSNITQKTIDLCN